MKYQKMKEYFLASVLLKQTTDVIIVEILSEHLDQMISPIENQYGQGYWSNVQGYRIFLFFI